MGKESDMNCPNCNQLMEKGNITLPNNVTWYPGEKKHGIVKNQIWMVGRWNLFGKQVEAYHCKNDQTVVFQYKK